MWAQRQIPTTNQAAFIRDARDISLISGLVLRYDHTANDNCVGHIPFTLFPSPYPKKLYEQCLNIHPTVNKLMLKVATDIGFLNHNLRPIAQVDDFTKNLLNINDKILHEGMAQPLISCINRADYMLDKVPNSSSQPLRVRQVEVNAIASAMSVHSCKVKNLQESLFQKYNITKPLGTDVIYPSNDSLALVAGALMDLFDAYGQKSAKILLINEKRSMNFSEHVSIELEVARLRPDIKFVRRKFIELPGIVKLGPNKELLLDESIEVAVIYFRDCYDPSQYNFEGSWDTRLLLERSRAIKCPSINFHLSGAKKFQEVLNNQSQLKHFLTAKEACELDDIFCKFWSFKSADPLHDDGYITAMSDNIKLVLKPQREGGGHNIFGKDIKPFVEAMVKTDERSQYILMEYIDGPLEKNWLLLHDDEPSHDSTRLSTHDQLVSELGIFGYIMADTSTSMVKSNKAAGYLVRSKKFGVNEGGVASGYAGISNLILLGTDQLDGNISDYYESILSK